jgi:stage II sporulation protein D
MNSPARQLGFTIALLLVLWAASRFLYPTAIEESANQTPLLNPTIMVELTALRGSEPIDVEISGGWRLLNGTDPGLKVLHEWSGLHGTLSLSAIGTELEAYRTKCEHLILETSGDHALRLNTYLYPGRLHIRTVKDKKALLGKSMRLSLELPLEEYVLGVLCGEMSTLVPNSQAALRAQAIAARTYALYRLGQKRKLKDNTADQVFTSIDFITDQAREAVEATRGLVLRWENELVPAYFHSNCGGGTANAHNAAFSRTDIAPLAGVFEPECRNPREMWERTVAASDLDALAVHYELGTWLKAIVISEQDSTGRQLQLRLIGPDKHVDLPADAVRAALHLPSTQIEDMRRLPDGSLVIRGYGAGHGVGLCQEGAMRLSKNGVSYAAILAHYYPSAQLVPLTADLELLLP